MRALALLLAAPVLLVACGGTAPSATDPPPSSAPAVEVTPGPASPAGGDQAACPEVPEPTGTPCFEVTIHDFAFDPASITVSTVARVVFVNEDAAQHSIEWSDGTGTSPALAQGESTEREFMSAPAGTIPYICGIHGASMSGEIVIDDTLPIP